MISDDLKLLMKLIFNDAYKPIDIEIKVNHKDIPPGNPPQIVNITLKREEEEYCFTSYEADVIGYCISFKRTIDCNGDWEFYSVKDIDRYYSDIDFLNDPNKERLNQALRRVTSGEYQPTYNPKKLLIEFLLADNLANKRHSKKFDPLKTDYYDILASSILYLKQFTDFDEKIKNERPGYRQYSESINSLLTAAFRSDPNHIKNFLAYNRYVDLSIEDLLFRASKEKDYHKYIFSSLSKTNPHPFEESLRVVLDVYRRYVEVLSPFINALRICIEKERGEKVIKKYKKLNENCRIIRESGKYSQLVDVYDPSVRHSESHSNTMINEQQMRIIITERKKGKRVTVKEMGVDELSHFLRCIERDYLPAVTSTFNIHEEFQLLLVITSFEYKNAILAINNKR